MSHSRSSRIAANRNRRAQDKFPLFADQLEEITAEQIQAAFVRHAEAFERCSRELEARGNAFRAQVALEMKAKALANCEVKDKKGKKPKKHWREDKGLMEFLRSL